LIGDSHADVLGFHLNEKLKNNNLSLHRYTSYMYLKDFNLVNRKTKKIDKNYIINNQKIDNFLENNTNLIVVFHQMWNFKILENRFDNEEGNSGWGGLIPDYLEPNWIKTNNQEQRYNFIREGLLSRINHIINHGHKLIIIYPVPEAGGNVPGLLYSKYLKNKFKKSNSIPVISHKYDLYKKRNKSIFEILDIIQHHNVYRVYPHKLFCDKQLAKRCVQNDIKNLYYYDNNHLSLKGSEFVVDKIIDKIEKLKFQSN
jgi:hypothetical protein